MAAATEILADLRVIAIGFDIIPRAADRSGWNRAPIVIVGVTYSAAPTDAEVHPDRVRFIGVQEVWRNSEWVVATFDISFARHALRLTDVVQLADGGEATRVARGETGVVGVAGLTFGVDALTPIGMADTVVVGRTLDTEPVVRIGVEHATSPVAIVIISASLTTGFQFALLVAEG